MSCQWPLRFHLALLVLTLLLLFCNAKRNPEIYCGACIAMIDELDWDIEHADPKSTIQVGSFRIDSKGNQGLREIPLARSELHLSELLETICNRMTNYGESSDVNTNYIRTSSRGGESIALDNVRISGDISNQLKFACETLLEDYEEHVLAAFRKSEENIVEHLCVETMNVCQSNNVTEFKETSEKALSTAVKRNEMNGSEEDEEDADNDDDSDDDDVANNANRDDL